MLSKGTYPMLNIIKEKRNDAPYSPLRSQIEPELKEDGLHIYHAREVGEAFYDSHIFMQEDDLVVILVGYGWRWRKNKWKGGHFYRHYKDGAAVLWKALSEADKLRVLDVEMPAELAKWAKPPGKLKCDYKKPSFHKRVQRDNAGSIIAYKYLSYDAERNLFKSIFYGETEWPDNSLTADALPEENNTNGIYCAKTHDSPILRSYGRNSDVKLVKLLLAGTVIEFTHGYRAEEAHIVEVL